MVFLLWEGPRKTPNEAAPAARENVSHLIAEHGFMGAAASGQSRHRPYYKTFTAGAGFRLGLTSFHTLDSF